ncbi:MAG: hypothetical protein LBG98_04005 [Puniceicoccales bacterium]|nr:hypothetical protein [Puniceicoccales bacterium]
MHLKTTISSQDCHVYQGTFSKDGTTYRYQVAIPANTQADAVQQAIQGRLQDHEHLGSYLKVYEDPKPTDANPNWAEVTNLSTMNLSAADFAQAKPEPTLVIGLPKDTKGSQQKTERYYVSDYDVYAIAHTQAQTIASGQAPGVMQSEVLQKDWPNCGEFADNRDKAAINFVNALLLSPGRGAFPEQALAEYQKNYDSNHRDRPIQHAAAAAGIVTTKKEGGLEGFSVPDFPLWVVESEGPSQPGNVIKLENAGDLAAYMINLSTDKNKCAEAIFNSKVLDFCVNDLIRPMDAA